MDLLGLEPARASTPQEAILGVLLEGDVARWVRRRLAIGLGRHHEPVNLLEAPAFLDETIGEPVEELRMARRLAQVAKVARGRRQSAAEVILPETIHQDARRQRVLG